MGNWNITIEGTGCHHNPDLPTDADRMAAEFVQKLRDAGHTVTHASITAGGTNDISQPKNYIDSRTPEGKRGPRCGKAVNARPVPPSDPTCGGMGVTSDGACHLVEGHEGQCFAPIKWTPAGP